MEVGNKRKLAKGRFVEVVKNSKTKKEAKRHEQSGKWGQRMVTSDLFGRRI